VATKTDSSNHAFAASKRVVITLVLALALVFNLLTGTYSGFVHAHDHDHVATDHHRDDHASHHDDEPDGARKIEAVDDTAARSGVPVDQTHEHPADMALGLAGLISWIGTDTHRLWSPPTKQVTIVHKYGPSERPPRAV
jgi:hypothetical protein